MKRSQTCKKVNRNNNSVFNHISRINTITPEILVGQIWLQEDEQTKSVQITELNSSGEPEMSAQHINEDNDIQEVTDDSQDEDVSHPWCYANNERTHEIVDQYKINKNARERRRSSLENHRAPTNSLTNLDDDKDNFISINDNDISNDDEKITLNHQMNYFTILNKNYINSNSSAGSDYEDVEMLASGDIVMEATDDWNHEKSYDDEIITYDSNLDKGTRTIWIYSFKNKRLLSENDIEMVNISGKETSNCSTSYSFESDDEQSKDKSTSVSRISSPIPAIPILNLSLEPALSTVTEVTESNKHNSSNETKCSGPKSKNSWIMNNSHLGTERPHKIGNKNEKSTNIVNWMALSPREKRRRFKDSSDKWKGSILHLGELCNSEKNVMDKLQNESGLVETVQVQADVHVSEKSPIRKSSRRASKTAGAITKATTNKAEIIKDNDLKDHLCTQDRGDHEVKCSRKPQITVSNKVMINAASITDPIEKLDSCNWIYEERVEKQTGTYDYVDGVGVDSRIDENNELNVTWIKNTMGLMKPVLWAEYLPITHTPRSLHLSLSSIVDNKRQSWYKRLAKCIICCK